MKAGIAYLSASSLALLLLAGCSGTNPESDHGHDHSSHTHTHDTKTDGHSSEEKEGGPNGGRIASSGESNYEILINEDRTVAITALNAELHPISPANQVLSLITGDRSNPTTLAFAKSGNRWISDKALPEGNNLPVIVNFQESPTSEIVRERFNANLSECPTCDYKEYACTCHDDH